MTDQASVSDMKNLIATMNEGIAFDGSEIEGSDYAAGYYAQHFGSDSTTVAPPAYSAAGGPETDAMRSILEAFYAASGPAVAGIAERADRNRELREAMVTEPTARGTRIGGWEIVIKEDEAGLKSYDVCSTATAVPIAMDLTVYDAALAITRFLNEGHGINSPRIRDVLNTEAKYDSSRSDAKRFKMRAESSVPGSQRQAIMEDRFEEALDQAKAARLRLSKIAKRA